MAETELRKMNRMELIEIIYALQQEEKILEEEKKKLEDRLENWTIQCEESGSIAEAAVKVTGILETAQAAADQYLEAVQREAARSEERRIKLMEEAKKEQEKLLEEAKQKADDIRREAEGYRNSVREECKEMIENTDRIVGEKWDAFDRRVQSYLRDHAELSIFLDRNHPERHSL